jgi:hypothetical protein
MLKRLTFIYNYAIIVNILNDKGKPAERRLRKARGAETFYDRYIKRQCQPAAGSGVNLKETSPETAGGVYL